ncbi:hypothetical protein B0H10DRAFT_2335163 [Mycena sp. CBHHK59/15]|nr:hypothetical protein B0H10DRAFT_2335163 [Mycena sp. CBHHK59/15]
MVGIASSLMGPICHEIHRIQPTNMAVCHTPGKKSPGKILLICEPNITDVEAREHKAENVLKSRMVEMLKEIGSRVKQVWVNNKRPEQCFGCGQARCKKPSTAKVFVITPALPADILNQEPLRKLFESRAELHPGRMTLPAPSSTPASLSSSPSDASSPSQLADCLHPTSSGFSIPPSPAPHTAHSVSSGIAIGCVVHPHCGHDGAGSDLAWFILMRLLTLDCVPFCQYSYSSPPPTLRHIYLVY